MVKKGFSLVETLVVMAVLAVFFACAAKVITVKPKPKVASVPHGYYECFYNNGFYEHYVYEGIKTEPEAVETCTFSPPLGVAFFNINTFGPNVEIYSDVEPNITNKIEISCVDNKFRFKVEDSVYTLDKNVELESSDTQENKFLEDAYRAFLRQLYPEAGINNSYTSQTYNGVMIRW